MHPSIPYRPDINGLRALAVLAVLLFHFQVPGVPGGFIGVDVFFVISGYLMTQIITDALTGRGFSLQSFYAARLRRIVPALLPVVAFALVYGWFFLLPDAYQVLSGNALSTLGFIANMVYQKQAGYFDISDHNLLLHTWSLAVEGQFYLLYALLLPLVYRLGGKKLLIAALWAGFIIALALCLYVTHLRVTVAFFYLPTRAWQLLAGGLVFLHAQRLKSFPYQSEIGLGVIVASAAALSSATVYPGAWALLPILGTALVLAAREPSRILLWPISQHMGTLSYSLYLWHWPLLVGALMLFPATITLKILVAGLTVVMAWLSYTYIETPARRLRWSRHKYPAMAVLAAVTTILAVATAIWHAQGLPSRVPTELRDLITANEQAEHDWRYPTGCYSGTSVTGITNLANTCTLGAATPNKILFWGDSHLEQYYPALLKLWQAPTMPQGLLAIYPGCSVMPGVAATPGNDCDSWNHNILARALRPDVTAVMLGNLWQDYIANPAAARHAHSALLQTTRQLRAHGKQVYLVLPVPLYQVPVAQSVGRHLWLGTPLPHTVSLAAHHHAARYAIQTLTDVARQTGATLLDPTVELCPHGTCRYQQNGVALYRDTSHLTPAAAESLQNMFTPLADIPPK